jgi:uncharacterized protein (DUF983 family)
MLEEAKCPRCGYQWYYRGKRTVYIKCPNCLRDVHFEEAIKKVQKRGNTK